MPHSPTIFVSIASYRDPECQWTVRDLFDKAARPERVSVGLCWQFLSPDDDACFAVQTRPAQVRCEAFVARGCLGVGWARSVAHGLRRGEDYVLQVDSHSRFHPGWDDALLEMLARCPSDRPVLSAYPAHYEPPDGLTCSTSVLVARSFDAERVLCFASRPLAATRPAPGAFLAGGYIFARAELFDEVPYDPALYFVGEEISFAARAWTQGWDPFCPDRCVVHHHYERRGQPRHWDDNARWHERNARSVRRVRHLLQTEATADADVIAGLDGPYGLGGARSLAAYEVYAGVDFRSLTVTERALLGVFDGGAQRPAGSPSS